MKKKHKEAGFIYKNQLRQLFLVMKLVSFILFIGALSLSASSYSQNTKIDLDIQKTSVQDIIHSIEANSEFIFVYDEAYINSLSNRSISVHSKAIDEVFEELFQGTDVSYLIDDRQIFLYNNKDLSTLPSPKAFALLAEQPQKKEISGSVVDAKGVPIPGATVSVKGTTTGVTADTDGKFTLSIPSDAKTLVVSFIGMNTQELAIAGKSSFTVSLKEQPVQLSEIVSIGYGVYTTREKLTGSIASVQNSQLTSRGAITSNLGLLTGLAAGVRVTATTSLPGVDPSITVRSASSYNTGSGLLYVIDGVVRDQAAFQALNPEDIATLSILKDAASAAIYGMKAGNGVLLVNTKNGASGKLTINYGYSYASSNPYLLLHKLNAFDYATKMNEMNTLVGRPANDPGWFSPAELDYFKTHSYNGLDDFWSNPRSKNNNLSLSGGNEKTKYFLSASWNTTDQPTFSVNSEKYSIRTKLNSKLTDRLELDFNLSASWDKNTRPTGDMSGSGMNFGYLYTRKPITPYSQVVDGVTYPVDPIVAQVMYGQGGSSAFYNAYINPTASLKYSIPGIEGLKASVQYAYNSKFSNDKLWNVSPYYYNFITNRHITTNQFDYANANGWRYRNPQNNNTYASLTENYGKNTGYQGNYQLNYAHTFGKHNVSAFVGYEFRGTSGGAIQAYRQGFSLNSYNQINGGSSDPNNMSNSGDLNGLDGMASWIGRLDYDFAGKYILGATVRRDGSYKFAPARRWGNFPAVSAGWIVSKENFFDPIRTVVSNLKLRGSFGVTGTDNTAAFQWQNTFASGGQPIYGASVYSTLATSVVPNPNITWEKNFNYNVGLDFGFLENALTFSTEVWYNKTTDILGSRTTTTPFVVGANLPAVNYGEASAQGLEAYANYSHKIGEFTFSTGGNIAFTSNKVLLRDVSLGTRLRDNPNGHPMDRNLVWHIQVEGSGNGVVRTGEEGERIMAEQGVGATRHLVMGVPINPGMLNAQDISGSNNTLFANTPDGGVNQNGVDDKYYVPHKYNSPRMTFGLNANIKWKGFELNMIAAGTGAFWQNVIGNFQNYYDFWPNTWNFDNINAGPSNIFGGKYSDYGLLPTAGTDKAADYYLRNMAFMRMKNISLSYMIPKSVLHKLGIQGLKFFVNMENPFMIYKMCPKYIDPESRDQTAYPILRNYSLGLNLTL